jgi:hypothetical protein
MNPMDGGHFQSASHTGLYCHPRPLILGMPPTLGLYPTKCDKVWQWTFSVLKYEWSCRFPNSKHSSGCEECTGGYQTLMSGVGISLVPLFQ